MDKDEEEMQKALGLFKMYRGYIWAGNWYDIFEVQDVSFTGAIKQFIKIIKDAQKKINNISQKSVLKFVENSETKEIYTCNNRHRP